MRALRGVWPLLLVALLLACCPVPGGASTETAFAARIESLALPFALATVADGRQVRLSLTRKVAPMALAEGARVYVEGVLEGGLVIVRRIAIL